MFNTSRLRQFGCVFADRQYLRINFLEWKWLHFNKMWLKLVLKVQINNKPLLVQIMARCQRSSNPLSETMIDSLTYWWVFLCSTRPVWAKTSGRPATMASKIWDGPLSQSICLWANELITGLILGLRPANDRWRYFVMTSLIGWAQI